jgi:serine/threonine protein kinase
VCERDGCLCLGCAGFVGSPSYIAPELMQEGARYDEKADVYSFGILMWFVTQVCVWFLAVPAGRSVLVTLASVPCTSAHPVLVRLT